MRHQLVLQAMGQSFSEFYVLSKKILVLWACQLCNLSLLCSQMLSLLHSLLAPLSLRSPDCIADSVSSVECQVSSRLFTAFHTLLQLVIAVFLLDNFNWSDLQIYKRETRKHISVR